eukprot:CAMPEP_0198152430 /NCGR_PEP_ID=MMETSP1443-20131203/59827_1 /TAXON_ID=186043 /ORGANISM="Entomoneis sp., Strain CCMP2396" /LENGTH=447 /DNA_ID=CAMNT_0043818459 /DNA_START=75 /DNA_END=1418 /DNA_ORIENTATION=-
MPCCRSYKPPFQFLKNVRPSSSRPPLLLLLLMSVVIMATSPCCWAQEQQIDAQVRLPPELFNAALDYAKAKLPQDITKDNEIMRSPSTLYQIAKGMSNHDATRQKAVQIFHILADIDKESKFQQQQHQGYAIESQVALGFYYSKQHDGNHDLDKALHYFETAGEAGPHQAALYNAGRIHAAKGQWVPAMAFIHAAATMKEQDHDESSSYYYYSDSVEETALEAFELLSQRIAQQPALSIREIADIFMYANLDNFPNSSSNNDKDSTELWTNAMLLADKLEQQGMLQGKKKDQQQQQKHEQQLQQKIQVDMEACLSLLVQLWESSSSSSLPKMSRLQAYLLLQTALQILVQLVEWSDTYVPAAAGYAEALALSPYCVDHAVAGGDATTTTDSSSSSTSPSFCFSETVVIAMKLYKQLQDLDGVRRIEELISQHFPAHMKDKTALYQEL